MKKLKKIVAVAIAATMITSVGQASLTAFAAEVNSPVSAEAKGSVAADETAYNGTCGENVTYAFEQSTGVLTISGTGNMSQSSPSPWNGFKELITDVVIEDGVENICEHAFEDCTELKSVEIASSVKSIDYYAFRGCKSLKSIDIPSSVKTLGNCAFYECTFLSSINLSDGLERIEYNVFASCNHLVSIEIPDSVMSIGGDAFTKNWGARVILCSSMGGPVYYYAMNENNGVSFKSNGKYFKGSGKCGDNVNYTFDAETQTLVISGTGEMYDYTVSGWDRESDVPFFSYAKSIKKIVIEDGVTGLGLWTAFCAENVEEIHFPASVTKIPDSSLPSSEKNYMIYADEDTYAYNYAIENWYCINGKIQGKCGYEVHYTFDKETGLLTIGGIGEIPWYDTYDNVTPWVLNGWNNLIKDVVIEEGVTSLGYNATFANCPNIKSLNISSTVTNLNALTDHMYLQAPLCFESINVSEENPDYSSVEGVLFDKEKTSLISYPINKPGESYSVPETVETIGVWGISYNKNLVSLNIPDSVTRIEANAFQELTSLKDVTLPAGLTSIENLLFYHCAALENITFPDGLESISYDAFRGCSSLKNVVIPNSVTSIDGQVFMDCTSLESVTLSDNMTEINYSLFENCSSLKSVVIPKSVTSISSAFIGCTSLSDVIILNRNVEIYGDDTFPKTTDIYGYAGSTADNYANDNGNEFIAIPEVKGYNVSLSGSIGLNYYLDIKPNVAEMKPMIKFCYSDGTVISELGMDDAVCNGYYQFTCPVSASKMGSEIKGYVEINGFEICISDDYSVQKYAEQIINGASSNEEYAKAQELVKAMLNYGAYSEIALTDVASSNINSSLTDEEKTLAELPDLSKYKYAVSGDSDKVKYSGSLISLKTETVIRHYFTVADGVNAEELTFTVNGNTVTPVKDGRYYRIDIAGVNAKNVDVDYKVEVDGLTLDYSVLSYVYSAINSSSISDSVKDSVKALYCFCLETKNYAA